MPNIILSFDDGRKDNYRIVREVLEPLRIPGTFNITTEYVKNNEFGEMPCKDSSMSKKEVIELSESSMVEIAGHGKFHNNQLDGFIQGVDELRKWCGIGKIGIASPHSELKKSDIQKMKQELQRHGIIYVRTGDRLKDFQFLRKCMRKINGFMHIPQMFSWIYKDTMLNETDTFVLYSVPVLKNTTLKELEFIINKAIKKDKSLIFMFHSIKKKNECFYNDFWSYDFDSFFGFCKYLKKKENEGYIKLSKTIDLIAK